jgi:carbon storage regulator
MLALTRRKGEEIVIAGNIRITVLGVQRNQVRLGITAPAGIRVDRQEIHARRIEAADDRPGAGVSAAGQQQSAGSRSPALML